MKNELKFLLKRDLKNSIKKRILFVFGFLVALMTFMIIMAKYPEDDVFIYLLSFLPIVMFGSFFAIVISFDMVVKDRESKIMDFLLTSPISKKSIITSKIITLLIIVTAICVIHTIISIILNYIRYDFYDTKSVFILFISLFIILSVYSFWAFLCSILFRKSKTAFFISALVFLFKPQLTNLLFDKFFGQILGMKDVCVKCMLTVFPEFMALAMQEDTFTTEAGCSLILYSIFMFSFIFLSYRIFIRQEELSYD